MGKGSSPSGTITTTQTNPQQVAQQPYLNQIYGAAQNLYQADPSGYGLIPTTGQSAYLNSLDKQMTAGLNADVTVGQPGTAAWLGAANSAQGQNSPAYPYYQSLAAGTTAPQQTLAALTQAAQNPAYANAIAAYANPTAAYGAQAAQGNLGLTQLGNVAQGQYLNSNPYTAAMVQAAMNPVIRNYQTAVAPNIDASFEGAGRYGSGAQAGAASTAQQNLGLTLANMSSNLYGTQYQNERQLMDQAAQNYGSLYNQGLQTAMQGQTSAANIQNAAGNQYLQGLQQAGATTAQNLQGQATGAGGLQSGYQTGTQAALNAAQMMPQIEASQLFGANTQAQVGQAYNQWQQQYLNAPYNALNLYQQSIGQPVGGSQTSSQPYFQNQGAGIMSGITGGLGAIKTLGEIGAGGFWIICTELVRQKRMPLKYWAVGSRVFASYPRIVQRGYHIWAIPTVRHLRRRPQSLYSRINAAAFRWRAEDLAARHGVKGARRLLRGRMVTWILYPLCAALGCIVPDQDWQQVYDAKPDPRAAR